MLGRLIVGQIRSLNQSIAELDKTIGEEGLKLDGHKGLTSIKGIGKIAGAILLSVIGDVNDFAGSAGQLLLRHRAPRVELE